MSYKKTVTLHRTKNQNDNIMKYLITLLLAVLATVNVTAQDVVYPDNMEYLQLQVATENTDDPYKCLEYLGIPELKIGNVCEGQISFSKMANTVFGNSPFNDTECCSCNVFPICGGGCPIDRNRNKGKSTKTYCTYYKKYLSEMLPYLYEYRRNNKS